MVSSRAKLSSIIVCCLWASFTCAATLRELTATPYITDIKISPSGDYLAIRTFDDGKHHIRFMTRDSFQQTGGISFPRNNEVGSYYWVNDERVVAEVHEFSGTDNSPKFYGELFAANYDGSKADLIFGYRSGRDTVASRVQIDESEYAWADVIDVLPNDKKRILISSTSMSESLNRPAEAMLLDTYTGKEGRRIKTSAHPGANFFTDKDGKIRLVTSRRRDRSMSLEALPADAEDWIEVPPSSYGDHFTPITISDDAKSVYVFDNLDSDKIGLHKLSLDGESYKSLYIHADVDITYPVISTNGRRIYALRIDNGYPSYLSLTKTGEEAIIFRSLLQYFSGSAMSIRSRSHDGMLWIVRTGTDVDAGSYYLFDRNTNSIRKLFESRPNVKPDDLAPTEPISFESFDGMRINGYFTAAKIASGASTPLVVLVHGGPISRDYWGYDSEVQALAANGFSVLQINYRGSGGYGLAFEKAGYRQWGNEIQKDIIAGTRWAIGEQRASEGNVCIMGGSFGAYSALQSSILAPDLFNCAVANAGIYDLSLMYRKGDIESSYGGKAYLERVIGRDDEELKRFSPVDRVSELQAPVFIAHGKQDARAPFEHAKRLRDALDEHNKPYEWFVRRDEAHGFYDNDNQVEYLDAAIQFLKKHLSVP